MASPSSSYSDADVPRRDDDDDDKMLRLGSAASDDDLELRQPGSPPQELDRKQEEEMDRPLAVSPPPPPPPPPPAPAPPHVRDSGDGKDEDDSRGGDDDAAPRPPFDHKDVISGNLDALVATQAGSLRPTPPSPAASLDRNDHFVSVQQELHWAARRVQGRAVLEAQSPPPELQEEFDELLGLLGLRVADLERQREEQAGRVRAAARRAQPPALRSFATMRELEPMMTRCCELDRKFSGTLGDLALHDFQYPSNIMVVVKNAAQTFARLRERVNVAQGVLVAALAAAKPGSELAAIDASLEGLKRVAPEARSAAESLRRRGFDIKPTVTLPLRTEARRMTLQFVALVLRVLEDRIHALSLASPLRQVEAAAVAQRGRRSFQSAWQDAINSLNVGVRALESLPVNPGLRVDSADPFEFPPTIASPESILLALRALKLRQTVLCWTFRDRQDYRAYAPKTPAARAFVRRFGVSAQDLPKKPAGQAPDECDEGSSCEESEQEGGTRTPRQRGEDAANAIRRCDVPALRALLGDSGSCSVEQDACWLQTWREFESADSLLHLAASSLETLPSEGLALLLNHARHCRKGQSQDGEVDADAKQERPFWIGLQNRVGETVLHCATVAWSRANQRGASAKISEDIVTLLREGADPGIVARQSKLEPFEPIAQIIEDACFREEQSAATATGGLDFSSYLDSERFADVRFRVADGASVMGHRIVLCAANSTFRMLLDPNYAARDMTTFQEPTVGEDGITEVSMPETDAISLRVALRHCYSQQAKLDYGAAVSSPEAAARLLALADRLLMQSVTDAVTRGWQDRIDLGNAFFLFACGRVLQCAKIGTSGFPIHLAPLRRPYGTRHRF